MTDYRKRFTSLLNAAWICGVALVFFGAVGAGRAATYHVVSTGGDDTNDGLSWGAALATISNAMTRVGDNDTVLLSNGTFSITAQIDLTNAVTFTSANGGSYTTLDAGNVTHRRVFYMTNENAVIDGITIIRGNANSASYPASQGGGVWMSAGQVLNCVISNNYALTSGAGIYMTGGVVSNCVVTKGTMNTSHSGGHGGGIYMTAGRVVDSDIWGNYARREAHGVYMSGGELLRSRIRDNTSYNYGAAVYLRGPAIVRNCLFTGNYGGSIDGGGALYVNHADARVENCTVAGNATRGDGGGIKLVAGTVVNSIVYYNSHLISGDDDDLYQSGGNVLYTCAPDGVGGTGNITDTPVFTDRDNGDFTLIAGSSPCINAGTNLVDVVDDIEGAVRPQDGNADGTETHDMGCYEAPDVSSGPLRCSFSAAVTEADLSLDATFTAFVAGANTNGLYYWWDFDNNGDVDAQGADKGIVSHVYGPGLYSVKLTVSNQLEEVAASTAMGYIRVFAAATFVATHGADGRPYSTWTDAATDIQSAIDMTMAGGTVTVSNGVYGITEQIVLNRGVTVRSVEGADKTVVRRASGDTRIVNLRDESAVLDGFTLANGHCTTRVNGGGVYLSAGRLQNCVVTNNYALTSGAGIYMTGGVVSNCVVTKGSTQASHSGGHGGGIYMSAGRVVDSDIWGNYARREAHGVYMSGGELLRSRILKNTDFNYGAAVSLRGPAIVRNCLFTGNYGGSTDGGGALYVNHADARVENCTVVGNMTQGDGGGIKLVAGTVMNSIVASNNADNSGDDVFSLGGSIGFTCSPDLAHDPSGSGNITNAPLFIDADAGDFRLQSRYGQYTPSGDLIYHPQTSPAIDAGVNQPWMIDATDIQGLPRIVRGIPRSSGPATVDMGAYEVNAPKPGTILLFR